MQAMPPRRSAEPEQFVDELFDWLVACGCHRYDEEVTQLEHALQVGALAMHEGACCDEIVACLLHDVGHMLSPTDGPPGPGQQDLEHELVGAKWLSCWFPDGVTEPVRLHVAAKRFLCATEDRYWATLSTGSKRSLRLQGGPMDEGQAAAFAASSFADAAIRLRRRDERGKMIGLSVPPLAEFRPLVLASAGARG